MNKQKNHKKILGIDENEFSKENLVEGVLRIAVQMLGFTSFVIAMLLLLVENMKWGGSIILFSFILNLFSIYKSLIDSQSIYRTMNLGFKLVIFITEIMIFNWILIQL